MKNRFFMNASIFTSVLLIPLVVSGEIVDHKVKPVLKDGDWSDTRRANAKALRESDKPTRAEQKAMEQEPPAEPSDERSEAGIEWIDGIQERADVNQNPYSSAGKLYLQTPGGDAHCSAQFVGGSKRVLLTAAHCVMDAAKKEWYTDFVFYRAYNDGGGQRVPLECISIWSEYFSNGKNRAYDYAFLYTQVESDGGTMGLKTKIPDNQLTAVGYPANKDDGNHMYEVSGTKGPNAGGIVTMNDNTFEHGTSGGAWIGELGKGNYAEGLNSHGTAKYEKSPYFDNTTWDVYTHVRGGGCND